MADPFSPVSAKHKMSTNVPLGVVSELITACKASDLTLVVSIHEQTTPTISIQYEIIDNDDSVWVPPGFKASTIFGTTLTLATQPQSDTDVVPVAALALSIMASIKQATEKVTKEGSSDLTREQSVDRAEMIVQRSGAEWSALFPCILSTPSWVQDGWLQRGTSTGEVSEEAATALARSLAHAWEDADQRKSAEGMIQILSQNTQKGLPRLKSWLEVCTDGTEKTRRPGTPPIGVASAAFTQS